MKIPCLLCLVAALAAAGPASSAQPSSAERPNIVLILCDNLGYGDVGPFGSTLHRTPHLDRMASEGLRLTHFYSASGVCTPSRASLMTGSYPRRVNLHKNARGGAVLQPVEPIGLHPDEITVAEVLKAHGYATALIGKWHLGDQPAFLPTRQGFDFYFGIPYSDDMTPRPGQPWPDLPLLRNETVVEAPVDRNQLTRRYTEEAIRFMDQNRETPFFLLLSHAMPGSTRAPYSSEAFRGRSKNGAWGDSVEELDWSTGAILSFLHDSGLEAETLVIWTSDNGAPERNPPQGSNQPLAGWGYTTAEGGFRVPAIVRWPGVVPAGRTSAEVASLIDILPTFARLAGAPVPSDRALDGRDIWPILSGEPGAVSPHEAFYYYQLDQLQAIRSGPWKLYLPLEFRRTRSIGPAEPADSPARLYNLEKDPAEEIDLAAWQPQLIQRLLDMAEQAQRDLGDLGRQGTGQRPAGWIADPQPLLLSGN